MAATSVPRRDLEPRWVFLPRTTPLGQCSEVVVRRHVWIIAERDQPVLQPHHIRDRRPMPPSGRAGCTAIPARISSTIGRERSSRIFASRCQPQPLPSPNPPAWEFGVKPPLWLRHL